MSADVLLGLLNKSGISSPYGMARCHLASVKPSPYLHKAISIQVVVAETNYK